MNFDLRFPVGIMFSFFGVVLVVVGLASSQNSTVLGININLTWGVVLLVFGALMLIGAIRGGKKPPTA